MAELELAKLHQQPEFVSEFAQWLRVFCEIFQNKRCAVEFDMVTICRYKWKGFDASNVWIEKNEQTQGQDTLTESCLMNHVAKLCNETKITAARLSLPLRTPRWLWKVIRRPLRESQVLSWCVSNKLLWRILMKTNKGISRICTYSTLYIQDFFHVLECQPVL